MADSDPAPASVLSQSHRSRLPDDTVFYSIFPDSALSSASAAAAADGLQSLRLRILASISPFASSYLWQHQPFSLSLSSTSAAVLPLHLHGKLRYGDNLEDEWFAVFLLFHISREFPDLSVRVWDTDGEFLLIEAAFHLPRWLNPETSLNRVFIRRGDLHIVPRDKIASPSIVDSLKFLVGNGDESRAGEAVQSAVKARIAGYPEQARRNMHRVRVRVPVSVAQVLRHEPCLISLAVEGFYDRDIDSMKYAARMDRFLSKGKEEEFVLVALTLSRAMYAQLVQQTFQAPKCYPMPSRSDPRAYMEAELGMKIACGFEMMYQMRRREGLEGKGSTWEAYRESLERSGYFEGLLPGSKDYKRLMEKAEEYYKNSSLFSKASEMMSSPVKCIDEILALPHSADDFRNQEVPPSDDDSWLYTGEDELNSALLERQKEMELYDAMHGKKQKSKEPSDTGPSNHSNGDCDLSNIAKTMEAFVHKVSSYKGAEIPDQRDTVDLDVDRFFKDMESVLGRHEMEVSSPDGDAGEGSSSDMDFDESEDATDDEDKEDIFMDSYTDALNRELKSSTLTESFVRANEEPLKTNQGASSSTQDMDEDFTPVDVDVNLVKNLLDSFSSQEGLPGPASNLLGLMGLRLPQDGNKGK
ncbi:protein ecdysoneless homolog isoform X2 [Syzygium oleosum]|uniref:protein ecdysoneless homolog isoform X2 n=1 Tax=Syzygium oleosum TaxID=219896 RepID=UPI0024BA6CCC|nr:protein ecdysoneless homolog isoform X2 [Syzygium oleosum]